MRFDTAGTHTPARARVKRPGRKGAHARGDVEAKATKGVRRTATGCDALHLVEQGAQSDARPLWLERLPVRQLVQVDRLAPHDCQDLECRVHRGKQVREALVNAACGAAGPFELLERHLQRPDRRAEVVARRCDVSVRGTHGALVVGHAQERDGAFDHGSMAGRGTPLLCGDEALTLLHEGEQRSILRVHVEEAE